MQGFAVLLAVALAGIHLCAGDLLQQLHRLGRRRWLSFASGSSVAYVFVHLLPQLAEGARTLEDIPLTDAVPMESLLWLVALTGLVLFYGLERAAKLSRARRAARRGQDQTERAVFWLHASAFSCYNLLIGYLLFDQSRAGVSALLFFWGAMAFHFVVTDDGLRRHHHRPYIHLGRWILAGAVIAGAAGGFTVAVPAAIIDILLAFLGGGVVLNVLKNELPDERHSRFWPFAGGAAAYTVLLLAI